MMRVLDRSRLRVTSEIDHATRLNVIRVLIVENMNLIRGGLAALLSGHPDMVVVAALESADTALPAAYDLEPDVILLGAGVDETDSNTTACALRDELGSCAIVIIANRRRTGDLRRAVAAGVMGYLMIDAPPDVLADSVRRIAQGERIIDSELAFAALGTAESPLTGRELDVLRLAAKGASSAEIAGHLFLSVRTVRNHISRIIGKVGARNRVDAIRIAEDAGWM
jgi:two-component system, NarL family, response regulator DesR